jgi:hypothetical protein
MERCTLARYAVNVLNIEVRYITIITVHIALLNLHAKDARRPSDDYHTLKTMVRYVNQLLLA